MTDYKNKEFVIEDLDGGLLLNPRKGMRDIVQYINTSISITKLKMTIQSNNFVNLYKVKMAYILRLIYSYWQTINK